MDDVAGICRFCGCTEEEPCALCRGKGVEGSFHDVFRTCCMGEPCIRRWEQELREAQARAAAASRQFRGDVAARWRRSNEALKQKRAKGSKRKSREARAA